MPMDTWLIAGLGNPGDKYARNRHNIGFMIVDEIARAYNFPSFRVKYQGLLSEGTIDGTKVVLLKPQTYMNLSGQSVAAAAKFYKIPVNRIIALHDELDLAPGKMRVKTGGGNAGHNGLKSMQAHLNSPDFVRVRLGIGHPGDKDRVSGYVLSDFAKSEANWLNLLIEAVSDYAPLLLRGQESDFMSKVAARTNQDAN
jgi:PTH1 family peptidyl-tRNA hydrolase